MLPHRDYIAIKKIIREMNIGVEYNDFPWKAVAGMRDITAHRYQTLRMEVVWWRIILFVFVDLIGQHR